MLTGYLIGYISHPTLISAYDKTLDLGQGDGPQPFSGGYKLGFTTDETAPAPSAMLDGPVLTSALGVGKWLVWLAFTTPGTAEQPITPLGWIRINP